MPALFKDFAKDAKDLVEKNYGDVGAWKLESKYKGKDGEIVVNPSIEKGKKAAAGAEVYDIKVDVEYNIKKYGLKTKTAVSKNGVLPTLTYESVLSSGDLKTELAIAKAEATVEYKRGKVNANAKLGGAGLTLAAAYDAVDHVAVGAEVDYSFEKGLRSWTAGVQYKHSVATVAVATKALKSYLTGIYAPVCGTPLPNLKVAVYADCNAADHSKTKVVLGTEFGCPLGTGFVFRLKTDTKFNASLSALRKVADGWKAGVTVTSKFDGVGFYLLRD